MQWFTADWHLSHANIIRLSSRPFSDVSAMNRAIIDRHNSAVRPDDHVWVLGDVALGPILQSLALVKEFSGHLHLLLGNHDRPFDALRKGQLDKHARWTDTYLEAGFDSITFGTQTISLPEVGEVMLSHFPYRGDHTAEDRFIDARPVDRGYPLLYGHVHEAWLQHGRMVNVGVDAWDFRPVSVADVVPLLLER